jgi:hypothetical protein
MSAPRTLALRPRYDEHDHRASLRALVDEARGRPAEDELPRLGVRRFTGRELGAHRRMPHVQLLGSRARSSGIEFSGFAAERDTTALEHVHHVGER